jgi:transposase
MPKEYPPSSTVYYHFKKWRNDGSWKRIHDRLVGWVRVAEDRDPSPSVASVDLQTVPTAVMVSESVGC